MRRLLLALALPLAACQAEAPEQRPESETVTAATPAAEPAPEASTTPPAPAIALDGEGLRLVAENGSAMLLAFGLVRHQAEDAAAASLGGKPERSALGECGAGPMEFTRYGPLQLNFSENKFVGWSLDNSGELSTMDGIKVGSTRAEVQASRIVTPIPDSTLGDEFALGEPSETSIGGFFEGAAGQQKVSMLYAGITCFFR